MVPSIITRPGVFSFLMRPPLTSYPPRCMDHAPRCNTRERRATRLMVHAPALRSQAWMALDVFFNTVPASVVDALSGSLPSPTSCSSPPRSSRSKYKRSASRTFVALSATSVSSYSFFWFEVSATRTTLKPKLPVCSGTPCPARSCASQYCGSLSSRMRLALPNVISSAVMITIGLALVGHTTAIKLYCNNGPCPPQWTLESNRNCQQIQGCLFYAEIIYSDDPSDKYATWKALRGLIGPDVETMFVHGEMTNGAALSPGKYWQATQFTCWRAWTTFSVPAVWKNKLIKKKDLSAKDGDGVVRKGYIDCTGAGVIQREVHCCKTCPI